MRYQARRRPGANARSTTWRGVWCLHAGVLVGKVANRFKTVPNASRFCQKSTAHAWPTTAGLGLRMRLGLVLEADADAPLMLRPSSGDHASTVHRPSGACVGRSSGSQCVCLTPVRFSPLTKSRRGRLRNASPTTAPDLYPAAVVGSAECSITSLARTDCRRARSRCRQWRAAPGCCCRRRRVAARRRQCRTCRARQR